MDGLSVQTRHLFSARSRGEIQLIWRPSRVVRITLEVR